MDISKLFDTENIVDNSSIYYAFLKSKFIKYIVRIDGRASEYEYKDCNYMFDNDTSFTLGEDYDYYEGTPIYISKKKDGVWGDWEKASKDVYRKIFGFAFEPQKEIFRVHGRFSDFDEITTDIDYLLKYY